MKFAKRLVEDGELAIIRTGEIPSFMLLSYECTGST
jgi:hypothetical protein